MHVSLTFSADMDAMDRPRHYTNLDDMIAQNPSALRRGPIAVVLVEDEVEIATTVLHLQKLGFATIVALMPDTFDLPIRLAEDIIRVSFDPYAQDAMPDAINRLIPAAAGQWMYYCYNAEYLFFPFCETRKIGEMLTFHTEERRDAMLAYTIDLYADDLVSHPNAVSLDNAQLDRSGYYALARAGGDGAPKERQLDFFGGLRWRYEEHIPANKRKIDRIALFRARKDLRIRSDHTFEDEEYNTYSCPWHHNLTAAVCSFRTAKALRQNPGSRADIDTFSWHNSVPFEWRSRQLLDLGLIEPGQWF